MEFLKIEVVKALAKDIAMDVLSDAEEALDAAEMNALSLFTKTRENLIKVANKVNSL